jgi:hypothetical protein
MRGGHCFSNIEKDQEHAVRRVASRRTQSRPVPSRTVESTEETASEDDVPFIAYHPAIDSQSVFGCRSAAGSRPVVRVVVRNEVNR